MPQARWYPRLQWRQGVYHQGEGEQAAGMELRCPQAQLPAGDGAQPWTREGEAMALIPFARLLESADMGMEDKDGTDAGRC